VKSMGDPSFGAEPTGPVKARGGQLRIPDDHHILTVRGFKWKN
jgi:hypothetical protein